MNGLCVHCTAASCDKSLWLSGLPPPNFEIAGRTTTPHFPAQLSTLTEVRSASIVSIRSCPPAPAGPILPALERQPNTKHSRRHHGLSIDRPLAAGSHRHCSNRHRHSFSLQSRRRDQHPPSSDRSSMRLFVLTCTSLDLASTGFSTRLDHYYYTSRTQLTPECSAPARSLPPNTVQTAEPPL